MSGLALQELGRGITAFGSQLGSDITRIQKEKKEEEAEKASQNIRNKLLSQKLEGGRLDIEKKSFELGQSQEEKAAADQVFKDIETVSPEEATQAIEMGVDQGLKNQGLTDEEIVEIKPKAITQIKQRVATDTKAKLSNAQKELRTFQSQAKVGRFSTNPAISAHLKRLLDRVSHFQGRAKEERQLSEKREDEVSRREFETGKLATQQAFKSEESQKQREFDANQKAIDRAQKKAEQKAKKSNLKLPQSQWMAAGFAKRIESAQNVLDRLATEGFDPASFKSRVIQAGGLTKISDPKQRQWAQAARTIINSILRRESGAAISEGEFTSARLQYFAQLGDDPKTLEQKRRSRLDVLAALNAEAGEAKILVAKEAEKFEFKDTQEIPTISTEEQKRIDEEYGL